MSKSPGVFVLGIKINREKLPDERARYFFPLPAVFLAGN